MTTEERFAALEARIEKLEGPQMKLDLLPPVPPPPPPEQTHCECDKPWPAIGRKTCLRCAFPLVIVHGTT